MKAYQLVRKDAPQTSKDAAHKIANNLSERRKFVLDLIKKAGSEGATVKELWRANPETPYSTISARPLELLKLGLIFYAGDVRDGARVMRAVEYKTDEQSQTIEQMELEL